MSHQQQKRRFGVVAVELGFITEIQLHVAMTTQLNEDLRGIKHRSIGEILLEKGYISPGQIGQVLSEWDCPFNSVFIIK